MTTRLPLPPVGTIIVALVTTFAISLLVKQWFYILDGQLMAIFRRDRDVQEEQVGEG